MVAYQCMRSVEALARVTGGQAQIDPHAGWQVDHFRSASSTVRNTPVLTPPPIRNRSPVATTNSNQCSADTPSGPAPLSISANRTGTCWQGTSASNRTKDGSSPLPYRIAARFLPCPTIAGKPHARIEGLAGRVPRNNQRIFHDRRTAPQSGGSSTASACQTRRADRWVRGLAVHKTMSDGYGWSWKELHQNPKTCGMCTRPPGRCYRRTSRSPG